MTYTSLATNFKNSFTKVTEISGIIWTETKSRSLKTEKRTMLKFNRQSRLVNNSYIMTISIYDGEIITLRFRSIENQESLVYFREGEKSKLFLRQNKPTSQSRVCFISYSNLAVGGESLNIHSLRRPWKLGTRSCQRPCFSKKHSVSTMLKMRTK